LVSLFAITKFSVEIGEESTSDIRLTLARAKLKVSSVCKSTSIECNLYC
jgi:hypothetical protein